MNVFILAGGLGTRIRALFPGRPKSMIPFKGKPFLEHQILMLAEQGFRDFVLCVGHQAEQIIKYFGNGRTWGLNIAYSHEPTPLGTGGALQYAKAFFEEPVLLLNGDTYFAVNYQEIVAQHLANPAALGTIAVVKMAHTARYGQVVLEDTGRICAFLEKRDALGAGTVNAGVYVLAPRILHYIPKKQKVSLERETFPHLLQTGHPLYGFPVKGAFIDIGTPEGYRTLEASLSESGSTHYPT